MRRRRTDNVDERRGRPVAGRECPFKHLDAVAQVAPSERRLAELQDSVLDGLAVQYRGRRVGGADLKRSGAITSGS
jgi:hypothetical protein